jgi:DNA-binding response OmpR family regulator
MPKKEKVKILVIDDQEYILRLVEATLVPEGYDVVLAYGGKEGLEKVGETSPDLILLDIGMPGLNGFEVLRIIRERYNTPVIMLTAVRDAPSVRDALNIGADDYVRKPFKRGELLARIRAKLRRAGSELTPPTS